MNFFNWSASSTPNLPTAELPAIFPMPISQLDFVNTDIVALFTKILTDVVERTHGMTEDVEKTLWDNCLQSESSKGLVTLLAEAMANQAELFLVYEKALNLVRVAKGTEAQEIKADYVKDAKSSKGVYISFQHFKRANMIKFYIVMEYLTVASLYKQMNVSKAIQIKISDLRGGVALPNSSVAIAQAVEMAKALGLGKDILTDAKDILEMLKPDLTATDAAMGFIQRKQSFYTGMPASYISGIQSGGLNATGEADTNAKEQGLKGYFLSVIKPAFEALFEGTYKYISQDNRNISSGLEVVKVMDETSEEYLSKDNKTKFVNRVLGLPDDAKGDPVSAPSLQPVQRTPVPVPNPA